MLILLYLSPWMKIKFLYILLVVTLSTGFVKTLSASEMEVQIDSLKTICLTEKDEVKLTDNYIRLSSLYAYSSIDSLLFYSQKALELARKNNYTKGIGDALFYVSYGMDQTGDWKQAIDNLEDAISIFREVKDTTSLVASYLNIGVLYSYGTQQVKALEYIIKAKNLAETTDSKFGLSEALTNIGSFYEYLKEYRSAYRYYEKALEIENEANNTDNISMSNIALGYMNIKLNRLDEAFENLKAAQELLPRIKDLHRETEVSILFAYYYLEINHIAEADSVLQKAHQMVHEQRFERLHADVAYLMGKLYLKKGEFQTALFNFNTAIDESRKLDRFDIIGEIFTDKAEVYAQLGQYEKAYRVEQEKNKSDAIIQPNKIAQALGEFELQEQIKEQNRQRELQEQLLEEKDRNTRYKNRVKMQIAIFSSILLVIVVIILSYYALLRKKHASVLKENYNTINRQKLLLEENLKQLAEDEKKLQKLNATKDKFFSIIAHDLKNPFNVMIGISDLMRSNADLKNSKEFETLTEGMFQAATSGYNLLENLLEWSRTQTHEIQFSPESFLIQKVFSANMSLFKEAANSKNISISCPDGNEEVYADYNMVNFIFRNLLNNAIKFSYESGKIEIFVETEDNVLTCTIRDYGIGMSEDIVDKLFKIEYSVQYDGTANEKGTGLGLILCKEFVEKNCGTIRVESTPGEGSAFSFELPRKRS